MQLLGREKPSFLVQVLPFGATGGAASLACQGNSAYPRRKLRNGLQSCIGKSGMLRLARVRRTMETQALWSSRDIGVSENRGP